MAAVEDAETRGMKSVSPVKRLVCSRLRQCGQIQIEENYIFYVIFLTPWHNWFWKKKRKENTH